MHLLITLILPLLATSLPFPLSSPSPNTTPTLARRSCYREKVGKNTYRINCTPADHTICAGTNCGAADPNAQNTNSNNGSSGNGGGWGQTPQITTSTTTTTTTAKEKRSPKAEPEAGAGAGTDGGAGADGLRLVLGPEGLVRRACLIRQDGVQVCTDAGSTVIEMEP